MTRHHDNDNSPDVIIDGLLTPEEIAGRITASSGVYIAARTVWEKARRIGVAKKIGRSMLISVGDVPQLLEEETKCQKSTNGGRSTTSASVGPTNSTEKVLALLQKKKRRP